MDDPRARSQSEDGLWTTSDGVGLAGALVEDGCFGNRRVSLARIFSYAQIFPLDFGPNRWIESWTVFHWFSFRDSFLFTLSQPSYRNSVDALLFCIPPNKNTARYFNCGAII